MTGGATLDTTKKVYDCAKCGQSFSSSGKLAVTVKNKQCCTLPERLYGRTRKTEGGCWEYLGYRDKWGYGHIGIMAKRIQAHRYSYELKNGPIPAGKLVLHSCDNPACINPDHLRLGSDLDNHMDMRSRGRDRYRTQNILTEDQVREIRLQYRCDTIGKRWSNARELGAKYGVGHGTIVAAVKGRAWRNVK